MNRERIFTRLECIGVLLLGVGLGLWTGFCVHWKAQENKTPKPATVDARRAFNAGVLIGSAEALRYAMESATNRPVRLQGTNVLNTIYQRAYDMFPEFRPPAKGGG